jgi:CO dehydrogenase nickel-insertion accessory protein CooC1
MMRIAVVGKGGSGKTTTAATLARLFARRGYSVTAIDDDPNPNLSVALGLSQEQTSRLGRVPREDILEEVEDEQGSATLRLKRPFTEVLEQYGACGPDSVNVLVMTGLLGAGRG